HFELYLDAPRLKLCLSKRAEARVQFLEDAVTGMDQDGAVTRLCRSRIERQDDLHHVMKLSDGFDPAKSPAYRDNCQMFLPQCLIRFLVRLFETVQDLVAQVKGIAERLERVGMFRHSRHSGKVGLES